MLGNLLCESNIAILIARKCKLTSSCLQSIQHGINDVMIPRYLESEKIIQLENLDLTDNLFSISESLNFLLEGFVKLKYLVLNGLR